MRVSKDQIYGVEYICWFNFKVEKVKYTDTQLNMEFGYIKLL